VRETTVFKSEEGKQIILSLVDGLLAGVPFDYKKRVVATSFGRTALIEAGDEALPPLVLLHGSCSNSSMWFGDMERLSKDFHLYAVDVIGEAGGSDENRLNTKRGTTRTGSERSSTRWAMREHRSWGIPMGMAVAEIRRDLSGTRMQTCPARRFGHHRDETFFSDPVGAASHAGKRGQEALNRMIFHMKQLPEEVIRISNIITANFNPMITALPVFSDEELSRLTMPVLYIAGEKDCTVDAGKTEGRLQKSIAGVQTYLLKGGGHVVMGVPDEVMPFLTA
jgi:pimeloyl-ACP methyl ester carboxylesterase